MTLTLLILAGVAAVADWVAVERRWYRLEYVLKPLTLALLVAAAATSEPDPARTWVVVALSLALLGDVAIMRAAPRGADAAFVVGLAAFLLGHAAYVVGFVRTGVHVVPLVAGLLVAAGIGGLVLPGVLPRVGKLVPLVGAYSLAVGVMAGFAAGTQVLAVAIGGALFVVSDGLLARERFAKALPHNGLIVASSYHLAQFLLVIGLLG